MAELSPYKPFSFTGKGILEIIPMIIAFSLPLPLRISSIIMTTSVALYIMVSLKTGGLRKNFFREPLFILIAMQITIVLVGLLFSLDIKQGIRDLERVAFLPGTLLLIYFWKAYDIKTTDLLFWLLAGCVVIISWGGVYTLFFLDSNSRNAILSSGHSYFTDIILIHPTYLSAYLIVLFFFLAENIRTKSRTLSTNKKSVFAGLLLFIVTILFFIRSQMGLLTFITVLIIYGVILLKKRARMVTFVLFTSAFVVFLVDRHRVATFLDTYGKNVSSALDQRFSIWQGSIRGIQSSPLFGGGTGGEQVLINRGYEQTGYQEGIEKAFNAHNQYLQYLARNGVVELLCFLAILIYGFKKSLQHNNHVFLMFNITVTLIMFAESFLSVQRGIVFFYFFMCAFVLLPYESETDAHKPV